MQLSVDFIAHKDSSLLTEQEMGSEAKAEGTLLNGSNDNNRITNLFGKK